MRFLFVPAMLCLRPLRNQVKLPLLAGLFLLPTVLAALLGRSPFSQQLVLWLFGFACYVTVAHYLQVKEMWGILLDTMGSISEGNLTLPKNHRMGGQFLMAYRSMVEVVRKLGDIVLQAHTGAAQITMAAKEIASGNVELSQRTEEQASTLEETASTMEQLSDRVKQNADHCVVARQLADHSNTIAAKGAQMVQQLVDTMGRIDKSSAKVADIVDTIEDIAFQTSILALNAAVEAERAGQHGRGFAVVAGEVRSLSQRSSVAAKEIKGLVDESAGSIEQGNKLVERTGRVIGEVVTSVQQLTQRIAEIATASMEQATGVAEVNRAIAQMEHVTQQNAALVEEATAAAVAFEEEAGKVEATISLFTYERGARHG